MSANHIQDALGAVQQLRQIMLQRQPFRGYSGPARLLSGIVALLAAVVMSHASFPTTIQAHTVGWGVVFLVATLTNFGAVLYWFLHDPLIKVDFRRLKPVLDTIPPLFVGAVLTFVLIWNGQHRFLFGTWMCMFGLSNLASRYVLPSWVTVIGIFYILGGALCLVSPTIQFQDPWPMGLIFFVGEAAGGLVLYADRRRYVTLEKTSEWFSQSEQDHG